MKADGSEATKVSGNAFETTRASWSADGQKIVFDLNMGRAISTYIANIDGTELTKVADDAMSPSLSPDVAEIGGSGLK